MITDLIIMFIIDIIMEITTLTIIIIIIIMIAITSEIISSYHLSYASYRLWLSVSILFWFYYIISLFPKFIYSILFLVSAYSLVHFTLPSLFYNHLSLLFLSPLHSFLCFYHFFLLSLPLSFTFSLLSNCSLFYSSFSLYSFFLSKLIMIWTIISLSLPPNTSYYSSIHTSLSFPFLFHSPYYYLNILIMKIIFMNLYSTE